MTFSRITFDHENSKDIRGRHMSHLGESGDLTKSLLCERIVETCSIIINFRQDFAREGATARVKYDRNSRHVYKSNRVQRLTHQKHCSGRKRRSSRQSDTARIEQECRRVYRRTVLRVAVDI